jgi:hypothetical protein
MKELDGIEKPDETITQAEYEAAEGLVRLINNKIVVGKTPAEKAEEKKQADIQACKTELDEIDCEAGAGRAVRGLALAAAEKAGIKNEDFDRLKGFEKQAANIREKLDKLK